MKIEFISFIMENGEPIIKRQVHKLGNGCSLSVVQPGDISDIPSIKIIRIGFFKFKLEVKSDNYRKFETKKQEINK